MTEKAEAAVKEFEDALNEELQGKLSDNPEKKAEREEKAEPGETKKCLRKNRKRATWR